MVPSQKLLRKCEIGWQRVKEYRCQNELVLAETATTASNDAIGASAKLDGAAGRSWATGTDSHAVEYFRKEVVESWA